MANAKPFGGKKAAPFTKSGAVKKSASNYASHGAAAVASGKAKA